MSNQNIIKKEYSIHGIEFAAFDIETSKTLSAIEKEFDDDLMNVNELKFTDNPIIIDIGANVGIVSFYFAKKYPNSKIFAYEPHPINYQNLIEGIKANNITNIYPFNLAVFSKSDLDVKIHLHENNTSASSVFRYLPEDPYVTVKTISLEDILKQNNISYIDFLKIDCEGAEFDILENTKMFYHEEILIENMFIEFHRFMEKLENKNIEVALENLNKIKNCKNIKTIIF
jgi:FkbM family methyltransferase